MNSKRVTHQKIFRHLCENLDQELNSQKCQAIKKHLDDCPDCITYLKSLKTTIALYRNYPTPGPSATAKKKLRSIIQKYR